MRVEVNVYGKWEATYELSRESLDSVYKLMDILNLDETEGSTESSAITQAIEIVHEENDL